MAPALARMMRFQLDPRGQPPERSLPPPPAPRASAAQPTAEAPTPLPLAAPTPPRTPGAAATVSGLAPLPTPGVRKAAATAVSPARMKLYAIVAVVVLLLGGGAAAGLYVMEMPPFEYPRRYMLEGEEIPSGMKLGNIPSELRAEFGLRENPGALDPDRLDGLTRGLAADPEEGWAQVLTPSSTEAPVAVLALRFQNDDDAREWASLVSLQCSRAVGALMRDGDVVVLVIASGTTAQGWAGKVVDRLQEEAPGLDPLC